MDLSNLAHAVTNLVLLCLPSAIYVSILRWRSHLELSELVGRLGLTSGG